jgi:nucleoid DNA-binding protein/cell division protein FtsN
MQNIDFIQAIESLLLEHDCVIIPNFGGFVINVQDFKFDEKEAIIHPRKKSIAFNQRLKSDDGILAMHIVKQHVISQKKAFESVAAFGKEMKDGLKNNQPFDFGNLGTFSLTEESKIVFEPNQTFNYDLDQFGLYSVSTGARKKPVLVEAPVEKSLEDLPTQTKEEVEEVQQPRKITSKFYAYILLAFIVGGMGAYILTEPNSKFVNSSFSPLTIRIKKEQKQEKILPVNKAIATSKTANLVVTEEVKSGNEEIKPVIVPKNIEVSDHIFLVAASFKTIEKAELGKSELIQKGFQKATILPKLANETYYRISLGSAKNMDLAYAEAANLKKEKKIDIWVFKKD